MIQKLTSHIKELECMRKYPSEIFYIGNEKLLNKRKISIVGTRKPLNYSKKIVHQLSSSLAKRDIVVVSGAAMGIDALSHKAAGSENTIAVVANGLDIHYPSVNKSLIKDIEQKGLMLSQFAPKEKARNYSFVLRNELVVALGESLIVVEADLNSGSLTSVEYALKMGKKVYTIAHRLDESLGTNKLVRDGKIEVIYDIDEFLDKYGEIKSNSSDEFLEYCKMTPFYDDAVQKFGSKIFEYELLGKIIVKDGKIFLL